MYRASSAEVSASCHVAKGVRDMDNLNRWKRSLRYFVISLLFGLLLATVWHVFDWLMIDYLGFTYFYHSYFLDTMVAGACGYWCRAVEE
jgi:hypothetical protein